MVAETGLGPASTDYESVPGGFTTPVYSASNFSSWLRRQDSNLHKRVSETRAFPARPLRKISIWWTWHDLNVRPRPSQSRALIPLSYRSEELTEATGVEPAHAMRGDLANRCHTIRRRLQPELAEGTGLEPASDKCAVVFGTTALPVRLPFQEIFS